MEKTHHIRRMCAALALGILAVGSGVASAKTVDCTNTPAGHANLAAGDEASANHLSIARTMAAGASISLDVCDGDLTIQGGKDEQLHITVDGDASASKSLAEYVQGLDVTSSEARVKLYLPKKSRGRVVVVLPANSSRLEVNLVRGDLSAQAERISGDRTFNVVSGHVELVANEDTYQTLHADVLLGSFHDYRKGGESSHGIISESLTGTGHGSIEVNIVKGSIDVRAWD